MSIGQGFLISDGLKIGVFHSESESPLQQFCTTVQTVISSKACFIHKVIAHTTLYSNLLYHVMIRERQKVVFCQKRQYETLFVVNQDAKSSTRTCQNSLRL